MLVHKHLNQTKPFQRIYPKEPAGRQLWERKHRVTHEFIRGATREGEKKTVLTVYRSETL